MSWTWLLSPFLSRYHETWETEIEQSSYGHVGGDQEEIHLLGQTYLKVAPNKSASCIIPSSWGWEKPVTCLWPIECLSHDWREEREREKESIREWVLHLEPHRDSSLRVSLEEANFHLVHCLQRGPRGRELRMQAASGWQPIASRGAQTCSHKDGNCANNLNELKGDSFPEPPSESAFLPTPCWQPCENEQGAQLSCVWTPGSDHEIIVCIVLSC